MSRTNHRGYTLATATRDAYFPVVHSVPDPSALVSEVLVDYDIGQVIACNFLKYGLNDTYLVRTSDNSYILRVYRFGWRSEADIHYELDLLGHLRSQGVPVSTPIAAREGDRLRGVYTPEGERTVVLFTYAPGQRFNLEADDQRRAYGRAVAAIHHASDAFVSSHARFHLDVAHLIDQPLSRFLPFLAHRPNDQIYMQTLAEKLRTGIASMPTAELDFGFCHGDCHGGNAHIAPDNTIVTFFDFDCGGPGWRAYDLAVFRWGCALRENAYRWEAFL